MAGPLQSGRSADGPVPGTRLVLVDCGTLDYDAAHALQRALLDARVAARALPAASALLDDTLLFVEHPPVYTLGRNADEAHLLFDDAQRRARGIDLRRVERGGEVTYHGPGQLVGYPIIDLRRRWLGAATYVGMLEATLGLALQGFGITTHFDAANRGVWVGNDKIAALGVRITRGMSMHGFALNVSVNLADYAGIVPCGIVDHGVASMDRLVPGVTMAAVKPAVATAFQTHFGYDEMVCPAFEQWRAEVFS
jgi:lipoyl(octanoyl) transferase